MMSDDTVINLRDALRARYPEREYAFFSELASGTGSHGRGYADVAVMGLWPSRGLDLQGFEIKNYRGDWLRELKAPAKAEVFFSFCDYWWLVTQADLVRPGELPSTWGHLEAHKGKLRVTKPAPKLKPKPLTKPFIAALLRRASETIDEREHLAREAGIEHGVQNGPAEFQRRLERAESEKKSAEDRIEEFEKRSGIKLDGYNSGRIGDVVRELMRGRFEYAGPGDLLVELRHALVSVDMVQKRLSEELEYVTKLRESGKRLAAE